MTQEHVQQLADQELLARLQHLVHADRALTARLLVHLSEVDARGLYRERAFSSMFEYCVEELHMSEAEAYLRIQAARLGRRFPLVVQLLAQGALHLTDNAGAQAFTLRVALSRTSFADTLYIRERLGLAAVHSAEGRFD